MQTITAADKKRVRELLDHLVAAYEQFYNEIVEGEMPYVDGFMGVHNFHKAIVLDIAHRQGLIGAVKRLFLKVALDTWAEAMEAEMRKCGN